MKPVTTRVRTEITRLPLLSTWRRLARCLIRLLARALVVLFTRCKVQGLENIPGQGPLLVVSNHLGDADMVVGLAYTSIMLDAVAKAELYDHPLLGAVLDAYGVIWIHRGQPDRRALRCILAGLAEGRTIAIAPEGRESLTGGLEEGTGGAAFLALKTGVPLLPVTFTGTQNSRMYGNMKRLHRTDVTMTVGPVFHLSNLVDRKDAVEQGTQQIMLALARQLPVEYRGVYQVSMEQNNGGR